MVESRTTTASQTPCFKPTQVFNEKIFKLKPHISLPVPEDWGKLSQLKLKEEELDERIRFMKTRRFPHSVHGVVRIHAEKGDGIRWGTGTLIGPNVVLTAAHNLYDDQEPQRKRYHKFDFIPGANGDEAPFGIIDVVSDGVYVPESYISYQSEKVNGAYPDDYGLLVLRLPVGKKAGYFGLKVEGKSVLKARELHLLGYPGDKVTGKQGIYELWGATGRIKAFDQKNILCYEISTYSGQSGSGIFVEEGSEQYYVVGVHTNADTQYDFNMGVGITQERFDQILKWISPLKALIRVLEHDCSVTYYTQEQWDPDQMFSRAPLEVGMTPLIVRISDYMSPKKLASWKAILDQCEDSLNALLSQDEDSWEDLLNLLVRRDKYWIIEGAFYAEYTYHTQYAYYTQYRHYAYYSTRSKMDLDFTIVKFSELLWETKDRGKYLKVLQEVEYGNHYLIVSGRRFYSTDLYISEKSLFQDLKRAYGEKIFMRCRVVYDEWTYDKKNQRVRKLIGESEQIITKAINSFLKDELAIETDELPVECFFDNSRLFLYGLREQLDIMNSLIWNS